MLYDFKFKDFKGKFTTYWLGPSEIESIYENGSVKIKTIDDSGTYFLVNGHRLKLYQQSKSKEYFFVTMLQQSDLKVVYEGDSSLAPPSNLFYFLQEKI